MIDGFRIYICRGRSTHKMAYYHKLADVHETFLRFLESLAERVSHQSNEPSHATLARFDSRIDRLRDKLSSIDRSRARVWDLDDRGHLDPRDIADRMANLSARKAIVEADLVELLEERAMTQESIDRDADAEALRRGALAAYLAADAIDKPRRALLRDHSADCVSPSPVGS